MNHAPVVADTVLGGWTVSGSFRYTSGAAQQIEAFNFFASNLGYNVFGAPIEYANYAGGKPKASWSGKFNPAKDVYFNSAAFSSPASLRSGTLRSTTAGYAALARGRKRLKSGKPYPSTNGSSSIWAPIS